MMPTSRSSSRYSISSNKTDSPKGTPKLKRENTFDLGDRKKIQSSQTKEANAIKHRNHIAFRLIAENFHIIANLRAPMRILDVPCGTGDLSKSLLKNFANFGNIVGIDNAKELISVAQKAADPAAKFMLGDFETFYNLPKGIAEGGFDLAVSFGTIHVFKDQNRALKNINRCLAADGLLIAHVPCRRQQDCPEFHDIILVHPKWKKYAKRKAEIESKMSTEHAFMKSEEPEKEYRILAENAGFNVKQCIRVSTVYCSTVEEIQTFLAKYAMKFVRDIPPEARDSYLKDAFNIFTKDMNLNGSIFERIDDRIFVVAVKL